jgi:hypothetical protein
MLPRFASNNSADVRLAKPIFAGDFLLRNPISIFFSNIADDAGAKFCREICLSRSGWLASLVYCIQVIVSRASKEKMFRPYAARIVAFVTNKKSAWNFTKMKVPCKSVGANLSSWTFESKKAVAISIFAGDPNPTGLGFSNFPPKPLHERVLWFLASVVKGGG